MIENAKKDLGKNILIIRAKNGKEALEIYQSCSNIKCIFMDINMPIMNGYDCTLRIRAYEEERAKNISDSSPENRNSSMAFIIGVSGNSDQSYIRRCQQVGMQDQLLQLPNIKKIKEIISQVYC
jgi:CheY-like chemotaxis protein